MKLDGCEDVLTPEQHAEFVAIRKELFSDLIDAYGGQIAVAKRLKCTQQYVSQLKSRKEEHNKIVPRWEHIWALETNLGRSILFRGLAETIEPRSNPNACAVSETNDVVRAAADAVAAAINHSKGEAGAGEVRDALAAVGKELAEAIAAFPIADNVVPMREAK